MSTGPTVHASAVRLGDTGILIRGPSGSGKSSLALALMDGGAELVGDDRLVLAARAGHLRAEVAPALAGLIEVRGQGIFRVPFHSPADIHLVVEFRPFEDCPRLPAPDEARTTVCGIALPCLRLPVGSSDGAVRVRWAAAHTPEA